MMSLPTLRYVLAVNARNVLDNIQNQETWYEETIPDTLALCSLPEIKGERLM